MYLQSTALKYEVRILLITAIIPHIQGNITESNILPNRKYIRIPLLQYPLHLVTNR